MHFKHFIPVLLVALATCAAQAASIPEGYAEDPLVQELFGTVSARERLHAEYQEMQQGGRLSTQEAQDFERYLADFDGRISDQCQAVMAEHPELAGNELPCPTNKPPRAVSVAIPPTELPEDAVDSLESELAQGLGDFDEMLLREQEKVASKQGRATESGGGGGANGSSGGGDGESGDGKGEGKDGQSGPATVGQGKQQGKTGKAGSSQPQTSGGSSVGKKTGGSPREEGDQASDDDVVARQLREAAEKETDPELRAKLWEEYRRYKQGN